VREARIHTVHWLELEHVERLLLAAWGRVGEAQGGRGGRGEGGLSAGSLLLLRKQWQAHTGPHARPEQGRSERSAVLTCAQPASQLG